jgi:hypothetical protein
MESGEYVVMGDIHSRVGLLERVVDYYGSGVEYISIGDAIDGVVGTDAKATVELLLGVGAIALFGNHEWVVCAMMYSRDNILRESMAEVWSRYHSGTLSSYGIKEPDGFRNANSSSWIDSAEELEGKLADIGHDAFFNNLITYYETDEFLAIHAGVNDSPWDLQKSELENWSLPPLCQRDWSLSPEQIFDERFNLSAAPLIPRGLNKRLVTGHNHFGSKQQNYPTERIHDAGRRIMLASGIGTGYPIYVWESWSSKIVPYYV